jgi:hypothetical protein
MGIMALDRIRGLFGRSERPQYSFELVNKSLLRENRKELVSLIAAVKSAKDAEKVAKTNQLAARVASLFEDVKVEASEASLSNFIRMFSEESEVAIAEAMNQIKNVGNPMTIESVMSPSAPEVFSGVVPQPRRVTTDIFDGVEAVAPQPRTATERGYAIVDRVLAEVNKSGGQPVSGEAPVFVAGSAPKLPERPPHVPGGTPKLEWLPHSKDDTLHDAPPDILLK